MVYFIVASFGKNFDMSTTFVLKLLKWTVQTLSQIVVVLLIK